MNDESTQQSASERFLIANGGYGDLTHLAKYLLKDGKHEAIIDSIGGEEHPVFVNTPFSLGGIHDDDVLIAFQVIDGGFIGHLLDNDYPLATRHTVFGRTIGYSDLSTFRSFKLFSSHWYVGKLSGGFSASGHSPTKYGCEISLSMTARSRIDPADFDQSFIFTTQIAIMTLVCPHLSKEWESSKLTAREDNDMSDAINFIETWQDNRACKLIDLTNVHRCYHHDFERCEHCNGEVEIKLPESYSRPKAKAFKCPHCGQLSSLINNILDRENGGE